MKVRELVRSAWVIGRRDFVATVMSKTFLLFLLGPLLPVLMGVMFGGLGARIEKEAERPVIAAVASPQEFAHLKVSRDRLAGLLVDMTVVNLMRVDPAADPADQRDKL